jgi:predicted DNA-binding mobile mystery protein A
MRNQKMLLIEQLDRKLKPFNGTEKIMFPEQGWIYNIRTTLNMTLEQLGHKLNMTKQGVKKIEERESSESITIKSLKEIGNAMDMQLVYGFVPKQGSVENLVNMKAEDLARKIVLRTNHNMKLENQGNSENQINRAIKELTIEIKREMRKSIWD